jgi:hypothetical protein
VPEHGGDEDGSTPGGAEPRRRRPAEVVRRERLDARSRAHAAASSRRTLPQGSEERPRLAPRTTSSTRSRSGRIQPTIGTVAPRPPSSSRGCERSRARGRRRRGEPGVTPPSARRSRRMKSTCAPRSGQSLSISAEGRSRAGARSPRLVPAGPAHGQECLDVGNELAAALRQLERGASVVSSFPIVVRAAPFASRLVDVIVDRRAP